MSHSASQRDGAAGPRERHPLTEMLYIAAPTVATMTSYTLMQFVDKAMVSRIGPDPVYVGAQGNGGLATWAPIAVVMGFLTVINTYVSQNLGAGRTDRMAPYGWAGLWIAAAAAVLLIPYAIFIPDLFRAMGHEGLQLELESRYARVLLYGAFLTMATRGLSQYFFGMHKPMVVLVAGLAGNTTNLAANSMLIYGPAGLETGVGVLDWWFAAAASVSGALGIPALGITGAALGTVIGTAVELSIPLAIFLSPKYQRLYRTRDAWRPRAGPLKDLARIGWPGGLMFGNEMVCWAFFMVYLVGSFGPKHSTAGWIAHQWMSLSFMPAVGISIAVTAMVGRCMGMRRPDLAAKRAWLGLALSVGYMSFCGVCFIVFRREMVGLFIDPSTAPEDVELLLTLGSHFLIATAAFQLFDAVAMSMAGALRGAGDTVWPGVVTVVLAWTAIVAGGLALVRFAPALGSLGPWIAASAYIVLLGLVLLYRFTSGSWKKIDLLKAGWGEGHGPEPLIPASAATVDGVIDGTAGGLTETYPAREGPAGQA